MNLGILRHWCAVMATLLLVVSCSWPAFGVSTSVTGQARAMQMTMNGITTMMSDTGTLAGVNDSRDGSSLWVGIPSLVSGENLSASTISWSDQVDSEASLARLNLTAGGAAISADFVMARASSVLGGTGSGDSLFTNLSINGGSVSVTGEPNQTITVSGGTVVINEHVLSQGGITVNAIHITINGADLVIASATAGISKH